MRENRGLKPQLARWYEATHQCTRGLHEQSKQNLVFTRLEGVSTDDANGL